MKKIYIAMAAALMLAACGKENDGVAEQGYDSFVISVADLGGAGNAKAHWGSANANGFYWDNGDGVLINGIEHTVNSTVNSSGDVTWTTTGTRVDPIDNGFFYVASYNGGVRTDRAINGGRSYGPVNFDGGIPLACKGKTNKLTLYPCCAVLKVGSSYGGVTFYDGNPEEGASCGTVSGKVLAKGIIDINNVCLSGGEEIDYNEPFTMGNENGEGYIVVPMEGKSVTAWLSFDGWYNSATAVTLEQGYIYVIE